uniref:T cell receptor beta variable 13 n=1 Tax=Phocoena sinus TaxID=42100 RepID=A0A8C9CGW0_PHOSS
MGSSLLPWVMLYLLGAGPLEAGVTQTPRHLIKTTGQTVTLRCSPVSGHRNGPQFLSEFYENMQREKGNFPDRLSAQQFRDTRSELNAGSLELRDSALYLCARSLAQPC